MAWTRFDHTDPATWPHQAILVLLYGIYDDYSLGRWYPDVDDENGGNWYDENNDLDDGWEPDDVVHWHPLPDSLPERG